MNYNELIFSTIIKVVSEYFKVEQEAITRAEGRTKENEIIKPVQYAIYLSTVYTTLTYKELGHRFGERDHSTIMHNRDKVVDNIEDYQDTRTDIARMKKLILDEVFVELYSYKKKYESLLSGINK